MNQNQIRSLLRKAKKNGKLLARQIRSDAKPVVSDFQPVESTGWRAEAYFKASKYYVFKQINEDTFTLNNFAFAVEFKVI